MIADELRDFEVGAYETPQQALAVLTALAQDGADEVERLSSGLAKWKARAQVMREAWRQTDWMQWISYDYPEAREWFDDDGVPRD